MSINRAAEIVSLLLEKNEWDAAANLFYHFIQSLDIRDTPAFAQLCHFPSYCDCRLLGVN